MAIPQEFFTKVKEALDSCHNPLIFFDDDPDGVCSFIQVYRHIGDGHGVVVKSMPIIDEKFLRKVEEYQPDKIIVLDVPKISEEFARQAKRDIIWIDHHDGEVPKGLIKFSPRDYDNENLCTSGIVYKALREHLWIGSVGAIADWTMPDFIEDFKIQYPKLLPARVHAPEKALFKSRAGQLARLISFMLKDSTTEVMKSVRTLCRIEDPEEVLSQTSSQGKFLAKRADRMASEYKHVLGTAKKARTRDEFLIFTYSDCNNSITNDLANELAFLYPNKVIIIGREKSGEVKMSIRGSRYHLPSLLEQALAGVNGYGGGHEHACGSAVKKDDFPRFLEQFRDAVKRVKKERTASKKESTTQGR
ncbi:MAG: DHH family phosphoesterase [archaeon]